MEDEERLDQFDFQTQKGPREEIRKKYRALFQSQVGREVLEDILINCRFGSPINPEDKVGISRYNTAIGILQECGMIGPDVMDQVVNKLSEITPKTQEVEK